MNPSRMLQAGFVAALVVILCSTVRLNAAPELKGELQKKLSELNTKQTERGIQLTLGDVTFETGKAKLKKGAEKSLSTLADILKDYPDRNLLIEGYTDSRGGSDLNRQLSQERAKSVTNFLTAQGISADRMATKGFGEKQPIASNDTEEGRRKNRRVELIVLDPGKPLPKSDDTDKGKDPAKGRDKGKGKDKAAAETTSTPPYPPEPIWKNTIELTSDAFKFGEKIPQQFTDDGVNISPPLKWKNLPKKTKDIVVMLEDPDGTAGNFNHWIIYGIPPDTKSLPKGIPSKPAVATPPAKQGRNAMLQIGYYGPAPVPDTGTHHYTFRIFALDKKLDLPEGAWKEELAKAMYGHVLAQGILMGTYSRPEKVGKKKP